MMNHVQVWLGIIISEQFNPPQEHTQVFSLVVFVLFDFRCFKHELCHVVLSYVCVLLFHQTHAVEGLMPLCLM